MNSRNLRVALFIFLTGVLSLFSQVLAENTREIGWEELLPGDAIEFDDPFAKLNESQLHELGLIARYRMLRDRKAIDPEGESAKQEEKLVAKLEDQNIDVDWILSQRERVAQNRKRRAEEVDYNIDGSNIKIPGYVLPLRVEKARIVEFLLVPWVGACIHTPPPPPNQMIHVTVPDGIPDEGLFAPIWIEGNIKLKPGQYDLFLVDGSAVVNVAYSVEDPAISTYSAQDSNILAQVKAPMSNPDHGWFQDLQTRVSLMFTKTMTSIRDRESAGPLWWGLFISLIYGVVHTLGPGHGKAVVISYFVGEGGSLGRGIRMGTQIAIFHVLSAILVVWLTDFTVRQATGQTPSDYRAIKLVSYALIAVIGGWMLWKALRKNAHTHGDHHHEDGCSACAATNRERKGLSSWLALAVGGVPCTGALLVLLFGMANNLLGPAILLVCAISLGMAVAMSCIGVLALLGRRIMDRRVNNDSHKHSRFVYWSRIAGASAVLLIGMFMFGFTFNSSGLQVSQDLTSTLRSTVE